MDSDPKLFSALRNMKLFPVDINLVPKYLLQHIPDIGIKSVGKIIAYRRVRKLNRKNLELIIISIIKAKYFFTCDSRINYANETDTTKLKQLIISKSKVNMTNIISSNCSSSENTIA